MNPLITIILRDVVLPEIARAWKASHNNETPTDAQVIAELEAITTKAIAEGKAFLDRTKPGEQ